MQATDLERVELNPRIVLEASDPQSAAGLCESSHLIADAISRKASAFAPTPSARIEYIRAIPNKTSFDVTIAVGPS